MYHDEHSDQATSLGSRQVSRRKIIKTAAHAAWMVPAIQVISAAPAFAAGSGVAWAFTPAATGAWVEPTYAYMRAQIKFTNSSSIMVENVVVTVTLPAFYNETQDGEAQNLTISNVSGPLSYNNDALVKPNGKVQMTFAGVVPKATESVPWQTLSFRANVAHAAVGAVGLHDLIEVEATAEGWLPLSTNFTP